MVQAPQPKLQDRGLKKQKQKILYKSSSIQENPAWGPLSAIWRLAWIAFEESSSKLPAKEILKA